MTGLLALPAAACSGGHAPAAAPAAERTAVHADASGPAGSPRPTGSPSTGSPGPVTLAFAGDVHFTGRTARLSRTGSPRP